MSAGVVTVELAAFLIVLLAVAIVASGSAWIARRREVLGSARGERAEAVLAGWLLAGCLSAEQYRRDMAVLAAREAHRRPPLTPLDP